MHKIGCGYLAEVVSTTATATETWYEEDPRLPDRLVAINSIQTLTPQVPGPPHPQPA